MSEETVVIPARELMRGMSVQHLRFTVRPSEAIHLPDQPGSALRGALYHALAGHFCSESFQRVTVDHAERCPVCWLMALEDPSNPRGRDAARPLTFQPPEKPLYRRDEAMTFGLALIGQARSLLPYLVRAVEWMGREGIGRGRGRFELTAVHEYSPLLDAERLLMDGSTVRTPTLAVTPARVAETAEALLPDRITLHFLTPTRLIADGRLVKLPDPAALVGRLLERCQNLAGHYAETEDKPTAEAWKSNAAALVEGARGLRLAYSEVEWAEVFSGSRRQGRATPISGFVGAARWEGEVAPLREWLLWGQSLHVGKDAVKGNGWYRVVV
jgi:hypothetical protein